ncbi:hypothetical protein JQX13_00525 [Archangium violaceum]|uniref:hypothetical protein n=1 Tax=Archangium violaceum TaxID=83451 RepID=UPI00193BDEAA|nr:hypothetical protein [Archangium violaceum]QRK08709.1 hypothetical protein JQX13_00525 [Archangium violaceum]
MPASQSSQVAELPEGLRYLPGFSLYLMAGASRSQWQHTLSPVKTLRYSLSFRTVKHGPH